MYMYEICTCKKLRHKEKRKSGSLRNSRSVVWYRGTPYLIRVAFRVVEAFWSQFLFLYLHLSSLSFFLSTTAAIFSYLSSRFLFHSCRCLLLLLSASSPMFTLLRHPLPVSSWISVDTAELMRGIEASIPYSLHSFVAELIFLFDCSHFFYLPKVILIEMNT